MNFKSARVRAEWKSPNVDAQLKAIVADAAAYALRQWQWRFTLTSIYRTPQEDAALDASGIHTEWRAMDVRTRGRSAAAVADVAHYANANWIYDPARPHLNVCVVEAHGTGPHAHFQVHPNTCARA